MKIEINDNEEKLILSNEDLDNLNFVDILIGGESITVPIDELFSAVFAFNKQRILQEERERNANN